MYSLLHLGKAIGYRNGSALVAHIPYIFPEHLMSDMLIPLNHSNNTLEELKYLCKQLHRGTHVNRYAFCGYCNSSGGYGPAIYSFGMQCAKCSMSSGVITYFFLQIFPITVFYGAVLVFRIDLTRPIMFHYAMFCSSVTFMFRYSAGLVMNYLYSCTALAVAMKIALTLSGVWSLDFLRFVVPPFCFSTRFHDCMVPFFDFFPAVYLLLLTLVIGILIQLHSYKIKFVLWMWRPFQRILAFFGLGSDPVKAVVHTYATFFALYVQKTVSVAIVTSLTSPAFTQNSTENAKTVDRLTVFFDPTRKYFDPRHITLVMIAFMIATALILPAVFILTFYHTTSFQRFYHAKLGPRMQMILRVFTQTLEKGYRDGSHGTRDYRPMSGAFFLSILVLCGIVVILLRELHYTENIPWPFAGFAFTALAMTYGMLRPYTKRSSNNMAVVIYGILATIVNIISFMQQRTQGFYNNQRKVMLALVILLILAVNLVYTVYITYKIALYFSIPQRLVKLVRMVCRWCKCPCGDSVLSDEEQSLMATPPPTYYK